MESPPHRKQIGIACEECRRKRIRCDRASPRCAACASAGTNCVVREHIPPRGPKKGYLKSLQKKIEDLESQLERNQSTPELVETPNSSPSREKANVKTSSRSSPERSNSGDSFVLDLQATSNMQSWPVLADINTSLTYSAHWDSIQDSYLNTNFLGWDQYQNWPQLPKEPEWNITPIIHNDLDQLFFDRAYTFAPIVHTSRYRYWSKDPNKSMHRICLQRTMWILASSLSSQFQDVGKRLYEDTRQLLSSLETDNQGQQISLELAQAWLLLAVYELSCEDFTRGMMSAGKAFRLVQMMRLYEVDTPRSPTHCQTPTAFQAQDESDWIDTETRRRTFWLAFTIDRLTSMVDGLQMFFDERMIRTQLPAPETNFASGRPTETGFLTEMLPVMDLQWSESSVSSFSKTAVAAAVCGQIMEHKNRQPSDTSEINHEFCRRHRSLQALVVQRIQMLRACAMSECLDSSLTFTALAARIALLMLYDLPGSKPAGFETQASRLTQSLRIEQLQQSHEAVADAALLVSELGQHFQLHPLTPILLLVGARFCQFHPEVSDDQSNLLPCIITSLSGLAGHNRLAQHCLQLLGS